MLFYAALLVGGLSLPPFPFPAAPLGLWGMREVRTRCGGDGGCTLETLNLTEAAKKSRVRGENAANATKPHYFVAFIYYSHMDGKSQDRPFGRPLP